MRFSHLILLLFMSGMLFAQNPDYCDDPNMFVAQNSTVWQLDPTVYSPKAIDELGNLRNLRININRPLDDKFWTVPYRPHVMAVHGYVIGADELYAYTFGLAVGDAFTTYGYGSSSIEFRSYIKGFIWALLGNFICSDATIREAVKMFYRSISDTRAAINYMYDHSQELGVDTTNFFLYGNSLGGTSIIQAALLEDEQEWLAKFPQFADVIISDPNLKPWPKKRKVRGIMNIAGNMQSLDFLNEDDDDIGLFLGHGVCDTIAPYDVGPPLGCDLAPDAYGSIAIAERAHELGLPYSLHSIHNLGHGWPDELVQGAYAVMREWLKEQMLCGEAVQECFEYYNTDSATYEDCTVQNVCPEMETSISSVGVKGTLDLKVFPNPGRDEIFLDLGSSIGAIDLEIYDLSGHLVLRQSVYNDRVDVANLEVGMYVLHFIAEEGVRAVKWVKE